MTAGIGFVGLGVMGKPMALNLVHAGYRVSVFDSHRETDSYRETMVLLHRSGARFMHSLKELATVNDIIITMLPDSPQVRQVVLGEEGLIHGLSAGKLYIDMSTIDTAVIVEVARALAQKGVETLDAPVSGGQAGAENGTLSIMAGGSIQAFEKALPVFEVLGKKISHMGGTGSGQVTKSCNQIATALATQGVIEALTFAKKAGVDPAAVRDALLGGFAQSRALELAGRKMIDRDFTPGFKIRLYRKDLRIALRAAAVMSLDLPGTNLVAGEMDALIAGDKGEFDFSLLISLLEK